MFDHLLSIEESVPASFKSLEEATPAEVLEGQVGTAALFADLGVPSDEEIDARIQANNAREAFQAIAVDPDATTDEQKLALTTLKVPAAVQHLVGMLTAYDWEFVQQAKELRGYTVTKIVEETKHPDARIRLKALQMLGNVTEVGLFTERVEVIKKDASEEEVEARLRERLAKFLRPVDGATVTDVTEKIDAGPTPDA